MSTDRKQGQGHGQKPNPEQEEQEPENKGHERDGEQENAEREGGRWSSPQRGELAGAEERMTGLGRGGGAMARQRSGQRGRSGRRLVRCLAGLCGGVTTAVLGLAGVALAEPAGGIEQVKDFATRLTGYVTAVAASVAVLFMAVNGVRWTMSSGNPARQAEAKGGLVSAAVGLAIALSAGLIVALVVAALQ